MAYIEENMKLKRGTTEDVKQNDGPADPLAEIFRRKANKEKEQEEGNVTNSMAMLTAIPEVDLGMECVQSTTNFLSSLLNYIAVLD
jgi:hypothetical protein